MDLVLQARPAAVREKGIRARTHAKQLLQLLEGLADRPGVGKRAEKAPRSVAAAAVKLEPRVGLLGGHVNIGITLVVPKHDVESRPVFLDQVVLEQQRLLLGAR